MPTYHRLASPTQTKIDADKQCKSKEVWGRPTNLVGSLPCVKAYIGQLPVGANGIEFETSLHPNLNSSAQGTLVRWYVEPHGSASRSQVNRTGASYRSIASPAVKRSQLPSSPEQPMQLRLVPASEVRLFGPLEQATIFKAPRWQVERLNLQEDLDDLGRYQVAYLVDQGVSVSVLRYEGNPPDTYTVMVDLEAARRASVDVSRMVSTLLWDLKVSGDAIIWRASEEALH